MLGACPSRRSGPRGGGVVVLVVVCLVACVGITALAIDGGLLFDVERKVQAAADAAALAAASDLFQNYKINKGQDPLGQAKQSAWTTAAANGYAKSIVTVNIPPASGPFAGNTNGYVEVIISYNQQAFFSQIWGVANTTVSARAVARGQWVPTNNIGIMALDPTGPNALYNSSSGTATVVSGGSVIVNSNNATAAILTSGGGVTAQDIYVSGGTSSKSTGVFSGTMHTGAAPTPDPLSGLAPPDPSTLPLISSTLFTVGGSSVTLQPGVYTGGISVNGSGNVTLQPGIYYINGGGVSLKSSGSLTGNGVIIYNGPGSSPRSITLSSSGGINITPPQTGIYQGISIFQDPSVTLGVNITSSGSLGATLTGAVYVPGAAVNVNSNGPLNGAQLIANDINLTSSGSITMDPSGDRPRVRIIQLVE